MKHIFTTRHKVFLDNYLVVENDVDAMVQKQVQPRRKRGRPEIAIENLENASRRTKKRRLQELIDLEEKLKWDEGGPCEEIEDSTNTPHRSKSDLADRALANFVDCRFTRNRYEMNRKFEIEITGESAHPSYYQLRKSKERCYPDGIEVTETKASLDVQNLFDHTATRLVLTLPGEILDRIRGKILKLRIKWGMDGLSALTAFKQQWKNAENNNNVSKQPLDSSLFMISMVPLMLVAEDDEIVWENPTPSSVKFCRPIQFEFVKETAANTTKEYEYYKSKIDNLQPCIMEKLGSEFRIYYECQCTMIDGKTCNVLTGQKCCNNCNLCNAKPSQSNNANFVPDIPVNEEFYAFGMSPLHCRIRFLEHLFHVACNMDFQQHKAQGEVLQVVRTARKYMLQSSIKKHLKGLTIDVVKTGYGTSNDGNTSRRFFENPQETARVLGINERLVEMYKVFLEAINCTKQIDPVKMKKFSEEVMALYVSEYSWYPMPPSVHKAFMHGWQIVERTSVPVGTLSEEAQEATNKVVKRARLENSRCYDRQSSNEDVLHYLLFASDPLISSLRVGGEKTIKELSPEAQSLMVDFQEAA
ncbi:hypothetical protein QAD02_018696 [Eretmocerus hayati]|uniref:Uncharacterized protein n=1 Tax=Eretmocerus hayati TaxID=131215 RepID=A0ACC2PHW6_9HYME|nr:hypothetical protein QAD02_018696 [Eretmocerus hayati]